MPEAAEVRLSADLIRPLVVGKHLIGITPSPTGRYGKDTGGLGAWRDLITPDLTVTAVGTRGKFMYWKFSNGFCMFSTFGMTGQYSPTKGKHPCMTFTFSDAPPLYFNDPRHFGTLKFVRTNQELIDKLSTLGWDPFTPVDKWENYIVNKLKYNHKPIGQALMDQSIFAGTGNYIRAESLYLIKMSPWKIASTLTRAEILNLCQAISQVVKEAYEQQGATILTYKNVFGAEGNYSKSFKVYGRLRDDLGNVIKKENTPDGRTMHWVPAVQV